MRQHDQTLNACQRMNELTCNYGVTENGDDLYPTRSNVPVYHHRYDVDFNAERRMAGLKGALWAGGFDFAEFRYGDDPSIVLMFGPVGMGQFLACLADTEPGDRSDFWQRVENATLLGGQEFICVAKNLATGAAVEERRSHWQFQCHGSDGSDIRSLTPRAVSADFVKVRFPYSDYLEVVHRLHQSLIRASANISLPRHLTYDEYRASRPLYVGGSVTEAQGRAQVADWPRAKALVDAIDDEIAANQKTLLKEWDPAAQSWPDFRAASIATSGPLQYLPDPRQWPVRQAEVRRINLKLMLMQIRPPDEYETDIGGCSIRGLAELLLRSSGGKIDGISSFLQNCPSNSRRAVRRRPTVSR